MLRAGSSWGEEFLQELPEIMQGAPNTEVPFHDKAIPHGFFHEPEKASRGDIMRYLVCEIYATFWFNDYLFNIVCV